MQAEHQQRQVGQQRQQGDAAPDLQRLALQQWARLARQRLALALFQGQQPFLRRLEALPGVAGQGAAEAFVEPGGQVRAVAAGGRRRAEARVLEGLDLAEGVVPGEQLIEGDARPVDILLRGRLCPVEGLGGDVAGRARQAVGLVLGQARTIGQAEVQQAQLAVFAEQQVLRLRGAGCCAGAACPGP